MTVFRTRWAGRLALAAGVIVLVLVLALYGFSVYSMNRVISHRVVKLVATPATYGLAGESVDLVSRDGIPLRAWWVPRRPAPSGVVVVLHGMDGMDASSLLGHAKFLHDAGYAAFVLDMRAHGRSGGTRVGLSVLEPTRRRRRAGLDRAPAGARRACR